MDKQTMMMESGDSVLNSSTSTRRHLRITTRPRVAETELLDQLSAWLTELFDSALPKSVAIRK